MSWKRAFDLAIGATGLVMTAPVVGLLAVAVKLDSPGPALFRQTRIGRSEKPFRLVKLRTMTVDNDGTQVTAAGDRRITRVGAFLRRTKLDELPQLWNVVRGDMSIVGPRPEVPRYVAHYRAEWKKLFTVRPGLTDLASLVFRDEERLLALASDRERAYTEVVMPLKLRLALAGIARESIADDLAVIARTAVAVVRGTRADDQILVEAARQIEDLERRGVVS